MVREITDQDFQSSVQSGVCVVDIYADWCGPCRMLSPTLDDISNEFSGRVSFFKLNIDDSPVTAQNFGVMGVPTVIVFKDGREYRRIVGLYPRNAYVSVINEALES